MEINLYVTRFNVVLLCFKLMDLDMFLCMCFQSFIDDIAVFVNPCKTLNKEDPKVSFKKQAERHRKVEF